MKNPIRSLISILLFWCLRLVRKFNISYIGIFEKVIEDCDTILDLGCGGGNSILGHLKKRKSYTLGVDIFEEYIEKSKRAKIHDKYLLLNILDIDKKQKPSSFDCVILMDVIEHLEKKEGLTVIKKMEKIARKKIVIFTPNGFLHQDEYHKNDYQIHKSGWDVNVFKKINFKIYGINGLKFIRGEYAKVKLKYADLWQKISEISNLFVKYIPQLAFQLLCVKEIN